MLYFLCIRQCVSYSYSLCLCDSSLFDLRRQHIAAQYLSSVQYCFVSQDDVCV